MARANLALQEAFEVHGTENPAERVGFGRPGYSTKPAASPCESERTFRSRNLHSAAQAGSIVFFFTLLTGK